jgi:hypothetical protein
MTNIRSTVRGVVAVALAMGTIVVTQPALAQAVPQASAPIQLSRCDFENFNRYYNGPVHYDLLASFTNRAAQPATMVGIIAEFFDEQGNRIRRLDAAYSGRFEPGQLIDHLRFESDGQQPMLHRTRRIRRRHGLERRRPLRRS